VSIVRSVDVPVGPDEAFRAFTDEIDDWYERGPHSWNDPERAVAIRFEGGRLLEVYEEGEPYELGLVTAWEPGRRLAFAYRSVHLPPEPETEVEVRFEPVAGGTRVTLEHRGLERMPPDVYAQWQQRAWIRLMQVFADYCTS
jgi:uncharacterized protein YndB with AHSA1/START domain